MICSPEGPNPSAEDMNWAVVIYVPIQIIAMIYWWFWGYKSFTGPRPNIIKEQ